MIQYSKPNVLAQAIVSLLRNDNTDTLQEVREVHFYVADRIYRGHQIIEREYPHISFEIFTSEQSISLPTGEFFVEIMSYAKFSDAEPLTKLDHLNARIVHLLTPDNLNAATSKRLRCRIVQVTDIVFGHIDVAELHRNTITLRVQCDAENTNVN